MHLFHNKRFYINSKIINNVNKFSLIGNKEISISISYVYVFYIFMQEHTHHNILIELYDVYTTTSLITA